MAALLAASACGKRTQNFFNIEIANKALYHYTRELLELLLIDKTTKRNIIWATSDYEQLGYGCSATDEITVNAAVYRNSTLISPRIQKGSEKQTNRTRDKAEVFTPSWICNQQNNLVDRQWFGREHIFNIEKDTSWEPITEPVEFSKESGKTWEDYILAQRMEITCGEAPYLVSRYDTVTGKKIPINSRIGLLDRKLRIVSENCHTEELWLCWAKKAYQSIYGYEFQGDNLFIARINLLSTFIEYYHERFKELPSDQWIKTIVDIITWNIWQMDGLKAVVPLSCKNECYEEYTLFGTHQCTEECLGCRNKDIRQHNGIYSKIRDWSKKRPKEITYLSLLGGCK